jgi:hypothetical protein
VLAHWDKIPHEDILLHKDTLSLFTESLLWLLNAAYIAEKQQVPIL